MAAYWLFVVLMLATFTANLAAFLTVERMQVIVIIFVTMLGLMKSLGSSTIIRAVGQAV